MRLQTMGHAISGGGFFNIDVEPLKNEPRPGEVFAAIIKFNDSALTEAKLADELKHMIDELWNWQVQKLTASEFAVVFPSKETLRMGTRSGRMFLPLSKSKVSIREAFMAPRPSLLLPSVWVQLTGVSEVLLERERLMAAFVMVGRPIDVDELSVQKWDREPIRMRFHCRYPERIKGTIQVCVNGEGYTIGVQAELGQRGGAGGSGGPPKPPSDDLGDFDSEERSSDDETWNRHGRKNKGGEHSKDKGPAAGSQPTGSKQQNLEPCPALVTDLAATLATGGGLEPAGREVLSGIDEYGSNLEVDREMIPQISLLQGTAAAGTLPGEAGFDLSQEEGSSLCSQRIRCRTSPSPVAPLCLGSGVREGWRRHRPVLWWRLVWMARAWSNAWTC
jgi:hypothetical protein